MPYTRLAGALKHALTRSAAGLDDGPALAPHGRCSIAACVGWADGGTSHRRRFGKRCNRKPKSLQMRRLGGGRR